MNFKPLPINKIIVYSLNTFIVLLAFTGILIASGETTAQKNTSVKETQIDVYFQDDNLTTVFEKITQKTGFEFVYNKKELKDKVRFNHEYKGQTLYEVLLDISEKANLQFRQINQNINVQSKLEGADPSNPVQILEEVDISGKITDENGDGLPGASVVVKGTSTGTTTDLDGNYKLTVSEQSVLTISFVGYKTSEITVVNQSIIDVQMELDAEQLEEVVVTAFGIEKQKKALSYAVQEVKGKDLSAVGNTNVVNSLQGKIAGVIVKQTSGAPGSRSRINIRGSRSFTGNNEPLYVIDGMPVESGDRAIDINPGDIKSVNVLKGPTAAALYGLRASNGVIVIETNKGEGAETGKPSVTFETSYNFDKISMLPETQNIYGQGSNFAFSPNSSFSWGAKISEMGTYTNQLGEQEDAALYDNDAELFETGKTMNTNLSIANAFGRGNYALNFGLADQKGILPTSGLKRYNMKLAGGYDVSKTLRVNTSINYSLNTVDMVDVPWWGTFAVPPSYNLKGKPTHTPDNPFQQINFRGAHDNFYWALENNSWVDKTSRTFGNINFIYTPLDWLSVSYRLGMDEFTSIEKRVNELGSHATGGRTSPPSGGRIVNGMENMKQINSNFNFTIKKDITEDLNIEFLAGSELYDIRRTSLISQGSDMVIGGFHHLSNTATQTTSENHLKRRVVGFFGNLSLSWKNIAFINATGRNDVVSNMPRQNRSFFYPSVGASLIFTEILSLPEKILTFGKIRASIAEVGQAGPAHSVETVFRPGAATGSFTWPYNNMSAFSQSSQINSSDLSPENTKTIELGFDFRFLKDRVGLDYTFYNSTAEGQIYNVPIAGSTGYSTELRNAGEMSIKGHEVTLNVSPIETPNLIWNLVVNFTTYTNKVISLAEGIEQLDLGGFRVRSVARVGEEYPSLWGQGYVRDPATGQVVVDNRATLDNGSDNASYGMPLRTPNSIVLGSAQPDFEVGIINNISFKNFTFSTQLDWRKGGKVSSGYTRLGRLYGVLSETADREADYIFPGMKGYFDADGNILVEGNNDITIQRGFQFYRVNQDPIRESSVFDATYIRLREIRLSYELPKPILTNTFINSVSIYIVGRNLWTSASIPHFDPEMFNTTASESYNSYPQTKSIGGGIRLNF